MHDLMGSTYVWMKLTYQGVLKGRLLYIYYYYNYKLYKGARVRISSTYPPNFFLPHPRLLLSTSSMAPSSSIDLLVLFHGGFL